MFTSGGFNGLGCVRTGDLVFIDLDGCRNATTGSITEAWANVVIAALAGRAYFELSPSETGFHIIARGTLPPGRRQWSAPGVKAAAPFSKNSFRRR